MISDEDKQLIRLKNISAELPAAMQVFLRKSTSEMMEQPLRVRPIVSRFCDKIFTGMEAMIKWSKDPASVITGAELVDVAPIVYGLCSDVGYIQLMKMIQIANKPEEKKVEQPPAYQPPVPVAKKPEVPPAYVNKGVKRKPVDFEWLDEEEDPETVQIIDSDEEEERRKDMEFIAPEDEDEIPIAHRSKKKAKKIMECGTCEEQITGKEWRKDRRGDSEFWDYYHEGECWKAHQQHFLKSELKP